MKDQIQFETNGVTVLAVPVPNDAVEYSIDSNIWHGRLCYFTASWDWVTIPKGDWSIHAVTREITEEQAKVLVEYNERSKMYRCYGLETKSYWFAKATISLQTLLRSHGIDPKQKNVLLINRKK